MFNQLRKHPLYWKSRQYPGNSEVRDLRRESTTAILLEQHSSASYLYTTGKYSYQPSSKKLLFKENRDNQTQPKAKITRS